MTNPAIKDDRGNEVPEGIMDAFFTSCISDFLCNLWF